MNNKQYFSVACQKIIRNFHITIITSTMILIKLCIIVTITDQKRFCKTSTQALLPFKMGIQ